MSRTASALEASPITNETRIHFLPIFSLREREAAEKKKKEDEAKRNTGTNKNEKEVMSDTLIPEFGPPSCQGDGGDGFGASMKLPFRN